jgi:hypothetical protein
VLLVLPWQAPHPAIIGVKRTKDGLHWDFRVMFLNKKKEAGSHNRPRNSHTSVTNLGKLRFGA